MTQITTTLNPPAAITTTLATGQGPNTFASLPGQPSDSAGLNNVTLYGSGHLRNYFERLHSLATNRTGHAIRRVAVMHCGDSLAERMMGWLSIRLEKEFPNNIGKGLSNTTNGLVSEPNDIFPSTGLLGDSTGDASRLSGQFAFWPDGLIYDLGATGRVTFPPRRLVTLQIYGPDTRPWNTIKVAYIKDVSAGSFIIETSPDDITWTTRATVNTSNATRIGAVETVSVTLGSYYVRLSHSAGGRVKVIGIYVGYPQATPGVDCFAMSQGGIVPSQFTATPLAIVTPILTDLDPALITFHFADTIAEYQAEFDSVMAIARAGNSRRSVLWVASHSYAGAGTDAATQVIAEFLRSKVDSAKIALFDLWRATGTYANIESQGWEGDGVHMSHRLYAYGYTLLEQQLVTTHTAMLPYDPTKINNLPQLFGANPTKPFGSLLSEITEPGINFCLGAGLPEYQGVVITTNIGPEATHPFALFAVQLFYNAYETYAKIYRRDLNNGTWSAWYLATGGSGQPTRPPLDRLGNGRHSIPISNFGLDLTSATSDWVRATDPQNEGELWGITGAVQGSEFTIRFDKNCLLGHNGLFLLARSVSRNVLAGEVIVIRAESGGIVREIFSNALNAFLLARDNHTGTQAASSISNFGAAARTHIEGSLTAGTNIVITPSGSSNSRIFTIDATGLPAIQNNTFLANTSGGSAVPVSTNASAARTALGLATNSDVAFAGGTFSGALNANTTVQVGGNSTYLLAVADSNVPRFVAYVANNYVGEFGMNITNTYLNSASGSVNLRGTETRIRNSGDTADANLTAASATLSGLLTFTGYTTALLPLAASNARAITYDLTLAKHVGCDGTTWSVLY